MEESDTGPAAMEGVVANINNTATKDAKTIV